MNTDPPAAEWPKCRRFPPRGLFPGAVCSTARSVSARIRSLYFAEKLRRFGKAVNSAETTLADATTPAAGTLEARPSGAAGKGVGKALGRRSGSTIRPFSCAPECKLQTVECRTLVGTVGLGQHFVVLIEDAAQVIIVDFLHARSDLSGKIAALSSAKTQNNH